MIRDQGGSFMTDLTKRPKIAKNITELIVRTPLVRLNELSECTGAEVLSKVRIL
jgi:cysteine synthase A